MNLKETILQLLESEDENLFQPRRLDRPDLRTEKEKEEDIRKEKEEKIKRELKEKIEEFLRKEDILYYTKNSSIYVYSSNTGPGTLRKKGDYEIIFAFKKHDTVRFFWNVKEKKVQVFTWVGTKTTIKERYKKIVNVKDFLNCIFTFLRENIIEDLRPNK